MTNYPVTGHMIVRNEDQFVGFAVSSVLPFIEKLIIYDTGSTDRTIEIIESIKSSKIIFERRGLQSPSGLTSLRNEMIKLSLTDWFFLIDADEVWNKDMLAKYLEFSISQPKNILATFLRTRNCVGDIYHYRDDSSGKYEIAGERGHLNIRAYRKVVRWTQDYPLEKCVDTTDKSSLAFFDGYYWHMTHLKRSSVSQKILGFRKQIFDLGIETKKEDLPEVFSSHNFPRRSKIYEIISFGAALCRKLK